VALNAAQENDTVLLIAGDRKRYLVRLRAGDRFHTHKGVIDHDALIGQPLGRQVLSHLNHPFVVLRPSIYDLLMNLKRASQIIYPKEIGQILLRLDVCDGRRIVEAGAGSGALTMALAYSVRPHGRVHSYEVREDMINVARKNLAVAGLLDYVQLTQRDIAEGFDETDADALFLDVREPWDYLDQALAALSDGGFFGALVPTTNQVSWLLAGMERRPLSSIEVLEILERRYKPVAARLRPQDVMVGHTGFLIFARKVALLAAEAAPDDAGATADDIGMAPEADL
jgi:tRNA (adenine57-N1/adenine58-N1)-methyltransferase catalytic subunit